VAASGIVGISRGREQSRAPVAKELSILSSAQSRPVARRLEAAAHPVARLEPSRAISNKPVDGRTRKLPSACIAPSAEGSDEQEKPAACDSARPRVVGTELDPLAGDWGFAQELIDRAPRDALVLDGDALLARRSQRSGGERADLGDEGGAEHGLEGASARSEAQKTKGRHPKVPPSRIVLGDFD
jgi:hypothetical protein